IYFAQRTLPQLILGGVFERHPGLKFVFTEVGQGTWIADQLPLLDRFVQGARTPDSIPNMFAGKAVDKLSLLPSEYGRRNCWVSSLLTGGDVPRREEIGMDKLMWGADFPHHEGTAPYTRQSLRGLVHSVPETDLRRLLAGNAADLYGADPDFL